MGDYKVRSNSLWESGRPASVKNTKYSSHVSGEPEYLCDIKSSVNFSIQKFPINPGLRRTFPWYSPQANCYEQYKPKGVLFQYRPTCGDAIASTDNAMGSVMMATEYNVNLPDFQDKQEMVDHEYSTDSKPSEYVYHPVECARSRTVLEELYVRDGTQDVPDLKFYDLGNFYIATQGQQTDGVTIGELWVTYEFELLKPSLSGRTTNNAAQHWYWDSNLGTAPNSAGYVKNMREKNTDKTTSTTANQFPDLPPGQYMLITTIQNSTTTFSVSGSYSYPSGTGVSRFLTDPTDGDPTASTLACHVSDKYVRVEACSLPTGGPIVSTVASDNTSTVLAHDVWIVPIGDLIQGRNRRAVEWDPMAIMKRRLDALCERILRGPAFVDRGLNPPCGHYGDDEKCCDSALSPGTPSNSPVVVDEPDSGEPLLSQSQVGFANLLLDRLNIQRAPKTGYSVRAA